MADFEMTQSVADAIAPALVVSFEDWVDGGQAGTTAARAIADGGEVVGSFDSDALYDYRSHRPTLDIVDALPKQFAWPSMTLTRRRLPERDLFVLGGPEPDYRWKAFAKSVLEVSLRIGVVEHVSLGAIPAAVPHTAPTPVMMTGSNADLVHGANPIEGLLRVPAAAVSLVEWTLAENGIPAVGFWAQVPHYANPFAAGAIALIRRVEDHLGVAIGAGSLEQDAATQAAALRQIFNDNPEAKEHLERLEGLVGDQPLGGADDIAEEVERFLRNQRRGNEGPNPYSP